MKTELLQALFFMSISLATQASVTTYKISEVFDDGDLGIGLSHSTFNGYFQFDNTTKQITSVTGSIAQSTNYGATPAYYPIDPSTISNQVVIGGLTQANVKTQPWDPYGINMIKQVNLVVLTSDPTKEDARYNFLNMSTFGLDELYNHKVISYNITDQTVNYLLTVSKNGQGMIMSNPAGINCDATCSANFTAGTEVTLTATPQNGNTFGGWIGDCTGTSLTCTLSMDAVKTVGANFKANQTIIFGAAPSLVVSGTGTVSATGGASGNPVTFSSATPAVCASGGTNGSSVTGVAAGTCTIDADQAGNANYNPAPQVTQSFVVTVAAGLTLTVNNLNLSGGTVTSNTGGINCGKVCNKSYASGTTINLQATPLDGYMFSGWGGGCSGYAYTCTLTMNAAKAVTANFDVFKKKRSPSWRGWLLSQ